MVGLSRSPGISKGAVCCRRLIGRTHLHSTAAVKLQTCLFHFYMSFTLFVSGLVGKWSERREATRCGRTTRCGPFSSGCRRNSAEFSVAAGKVSELKSGTPGTKPVRAFYPPPTHTHNAHTHYQPDGSSLEPWCVVERLLYKIIFPDKLNVINGRKIAVIQIYKK